MNKFDFCRNFIARTFSCV